MLKKITIGSNNFTMYHKLVIILHVGVFNIINLHANEVSPGIVYLISSAKPDSIMLRWAPGNIEAWRHGNTYGYKLEKIPILRDSSIIENPTSQPLLKGKLPLPLAAWEKQVKANKWAAIAAQALYGEEFRPQLDEEVSIETYYLKSKEEGQRFSFALHAADMSPEVAKMSALMYVDKDVKASEKYLYRLMIDYPDTLKHLQDTSLAFTGVEDYIPLPKPFEFEVSFKSKSAILKWNAFAHENTYISWETERSDDGGESFQPVKFGSGFQLEQSNQVKPEFMYAIDSFPKNGVVYKYRLRGISSFGEKGPWSGVISGQGKAPIKSSPSISGYQVLKEKVTLKWEFPRGEEDMIDGFILLRSENDQNDFKRVSNIIKPNLREYTDKHPLNTGYYKIEAFREGTVSKKSFPYLIQLSDNIPPGKPTGLKGEADSNLVVTLSWKANKEDDIEGYVVFRSESGNDEFSRMNNKVILQNSFMDTLVKNNLNKQVLYKIAAYDKRYNQSELSDILVVEKPDVIKPSAPVWVETTNKKNGVSLKWIGSSSKDVDYYNLKIMDLSKDSIWHINTIHHEEKVNHYEYFDKSPPWDQTIKYFLTAVDGSGNESSLVESISIAPNGLMANKDKLKLTYNVDQESGKLILFWNTLQNVISYRIYMNRENEGYTLLYTLDGEKNSIELDGVKIGKTYRYTLKAYAINNQIITSDELKLIF